MEAEQIINLIIAILSGLAAAIPLIVELVKYVKKAAKGNNWSSVMALILKLMAEAEENYKTGAEKKEYVMDSIIAIKDTLNFEVDMDVISAMIDALCAMAKEVNVEKKAD